MNPGGHRSVLNGVVDVIAADPGDLAAGWKILTLRRAPGTRCTGSWEVVHGRIGIHERPEQAAVRELREETGLEARRLYNVTCQSFYLHSTGQVQQVVVFLAVVEQGAVQLGPEHDAFAWLPRDAALLRLSWPRTRQAIEIAASMLCGENGDAGPLEDVLRVF
ncbi:MAG: NUDIX domain-containing protein [Gemmatimonadota bacterium]